MLHFNSRDLKPVLTKLLNTRFSCFKRELDIRFNIEMALILNTDVITQYETSIIEGYYYFPFTFVRMSNEHDFICSLKMDTLLKFYM